MLVADDDADHRELLAITLRRGGHHVVTAPDARGAWDLLRDEEVDAALIDVRMPGEDGITLTRRLRAEPRTALLPVMLVSADVNGRRIVSALQAGADDYLTKPFHRAELCAPVDNLLLRRKTRPAAAALAAARHAVLPTVPERAVRRTA